MKSGIATIGAVIAAGLIAGLYFLIGIGWLGLAIVAGVVLLSYILANVTAGSGFGEFMRGWLVGMNAGLNGFLGLLVYRFLFGADVGLIIAIVVSLFNFLAVLAPVSQNGVYQGLLGWFNWFMPMSWLIAGLGLLFFVTNVLTYLIFHLIFRIEYVRILDLDADWKTGTFFMHGGLISNLNPIDTAFNMGNFAFVDRASHHWHIEHEAGHTLNLGAFGSFFHLIGAIDENITGGGTDAYSERLAESDNSGSSGRNIPMWA